MIEIHRQEDCCGCTACASVCPVNCIKMQEDSEGFKYPVVDKSRCIDCGKCERICPVINRPLNDKKPKAYLARTKDDVLLQKCTSGGVFTEIARRIIEQGGIAYGVVYDQDFNVCHERVCDLAGVARLPGSKYVQSNLDGAFGRILDDVKAEKQVVFCGTPCQVAGLKNFLGREYDNLLLIDLVCHGVPSPKLWKAYVDYLEAKNGKLKYANFRSKRLGYHVSVMEEHFENGKIQIGSARTNLMSKCFFQNAADRPICYECPFKTIARCSDLTIFDGWHAGEYVAGLHDDDRGYTIILIQSEKGLSYLNKQCILDIAPIDTDDAMAKDGKMAVNSVIRPKCRDVFYNMLDEKGIENTVKDLFPITYMDNVIEKLKFVLDKLGMLQMIKLMKRD